MSEVSQWMRICRKQSRRHGGPLAKKRQFHCNPARLLQLPFAGVKNSAKLALRERWIRGIANTTFRIPDGIPESEQLGESMGQPVKLAQFGEHSEEISLQPASLDIWDSKYRLKTKKGEILDHDLHATYARVARTLAEVEPEPIREQWFESFLWALSHGAVPAGRIVSNAGAQEHKPATSTINCTVSGTVRDSMNGILEMAHEAGLTLKAGCGIGYEFSTLRPRGAYVAGAGAYTSGPLSFMDIYDKVCFTVSSAGGRRGAQMGTFDVGHPDVREFITAKREDGRLRQFNLSLMITDEFMQAVEAEGEWVMAFPLEPSEAEEDGLDLGDSAKVVWREWPVTEGYITDPEGRVACKVYGSLPARELFDLIMRSTYDFAEPGFILIDRVNEMNNNWYAENIRATNPCGEQPLPPYGACLLGSVNLTRFVRRAFTPPGAFRLGGIQRSGGDLHPHARQRGGDQRPAAGHPGARNSAQAAPRHGLSGAGLHAGHAAHPLRQR